MNRPIKFRAWDKKHGSKMVDVRAIDFLETGEPYCIHYCEMDKRGDEYRISLAPDVFELMQFTGLTDKNGKEIYEGDVVSVHLNGPDKEPCVREVIWKFSGFYIPVSGGGDFVALHREPIIEVIGDVYQNPELLSAHT